MEILIERQDRRKSKGKRQIEHRTKSKVESEKVKLAAALCASLMCLCGGLSLALLRALDCLRALHHSQPEEVCRLHHRGILQREFACADQT